MYNETWTIQKKMEIYSTQDQEKQNIHTTQYMFDITVQTNTNNVNKTWVLLQTTGGKDEPSIVLYAEILTDFTTRNSERANTSKEKVKILNYEKHGPLQNRRWTRMLATGKQSRFL